MNGNTKSALTPYENAVDSEVGIVDLLIVIATYKRLILGMTAAAAIVGSIICVALPDVYKATTKVLPPQQAQSGAAALLSQLGGVAATAASAAGLKSPNDVYIGMLKSRTIADKLIRQYDLQKVYKVTTLEKTRKILEENTVIATTKEGLINIDVEDHSRALVAKLANSYVNELIGLTKTLAVTEAGQRRMFYERQLEEAKDNLAKAEMKLKGSLDAHGVVSVDVDSRAILESAAKIRAQISAKEIQLDSMKAFVTPDNQAFKQAQEELRSLKEEAYRLENGREKDRSEPKAESKSDGLQNIKTLRDVKYYQMLYELLAKQYEVARLDESKDSSLIQVLDVAQEPERKSKPKRILIVLIISIFGFLAGIGTAFFLSAKQKWVSTPEGFARFEKLRQSMRF
jgi:tyrosine-protein kinase Etk/Wzc